MKTFVITIVLTVSDKCNEYKANLGMVKRLVDERSKKGVIDKKFFRQRVVLDVQDIKSDVMEL